MKLKEFFNHRERLIASLEKGEIDKASFIRENYNFFLSEEHGPYDNPQTFEEGLYNYQYYNTVAKYLRIQARELKYTDPFVAAANKKEAQKLYRMKEEVTLVLLRLYSDGPVEAYYIPMASKTLGGKLFEIHFKDLDKVILHSMDPRVLKLLRKRGVFDTSVRKSLIEAYINSLYE
ncbi:MAG: hypothetical protein AVO33_00890 [delta proteobacterium ML8_F1]|nr:MAG: hypothetical protein AVO33_00890 [delta proteobacterium ML8_F1]